MSKSTQPIAVTVVGQGFSGLVAAWSLVRAGFQVTVRADSANVGGMIDSIESKLGLIETAANGLLSSPLVEELFEDCGVEIQIPKKSSRRRFLLVNSQISRFPLSFFETFQTMMKLFEIKKNPPRRFETVEGWGRRVLGSAITDKVLSVATLGIFASPGRELSASLITQKFFNPRRRRRSAGKQKYRGTISARGGVGALLKALRRRLENLGVVFEASSASQVVESLKADRAAGRIIVLAVPAWSAARLLRDLESSRGESGVSRDPRMEALEKVVAVPLISITAFFKEPPPKVGFGTLFAQNSPFGEADGLLGALQNSEIFDDRAANGIHSETWILGGLTQGEHLLRETDTNLENLILKKRSRFIDSRSNEKFLESHVTRWPKALPHYSTDLEALIPILATDFGDVVLFGNYLGHLGLSSILESSLELPERIAGVLK